MQLDFCAPAALPERCQPPTPAALSRVSQQPDASSHTRGGATVRTCNAVLYVLPGLLQPTARQYSRQWQLPSASTDAPAAAAAA